MSPGRYVPVLRLGVGAFADVYLGVLQGAKGTRRPVVLKRAFADMSADDPEARQALLEEARVASALAHPNVVHVYELFEAPEGLMLAMEYLPGASLQNLLEHLEGSGGRVPWAVAARIVADAARGLHHAHHATGPDGRPLRIVHRDVSPKNLVVTQQGITKVLDFGIARSALREVTAHLVVKGTLGYLSPEQARAEPLDWRSDVFALGIVLHELLSGPPPIPGEESGSAAAAALRDKLPPLPDGLPPQLVDAVDRMLVREAERRRIDMAAVADLLESLAARRGGDHREVAAFLEAEMGPALAARRERVAAILGGAVGAPAALTAKEETATLALLEAALDDLDTLPDPMDLAADTLVYEPRAPAPPEGDGTATDIDFDVDRGSDGDGTA